MYLMVGTAKFEWILKYKNRKDNRNSEIAGKKILTIIITFVWWYMYDKKLGAVHIELLVVELY